MGICCNHKKEISMSVQISRQTKQQKKRRKRKKKTIVLLVLLLITAIALPTAGLIAYTHYMVTPVDAQNTQDETFTFAERETVRNIAQTLKNSGIIKEGWALQVRAKQRKIDFVKKEGEYAFNRAMKLDDILDILAEGRTKYDWKMVIGDGSLIDKLLSDFTSNDAEIPELDAKINDLSYVQTLQQKYPFLPNDILGDGFRHRLEGFLAPGTYYLKDDDDITVFIDQALNKFAQNYADNQLDQKLKDANTTLFEAVTMASVVRGEVMSGDTENQRIVAGVFYNRLEQNMNLGSDVTVGYSLGLSELNYTEDQLENDSPYNTYRYPGLPRGPISNPGVDVIMAVLVAEKTDYLFFLADVCDDNIGEFGQIYYAATAGEHNDNARKYLGCYRTSFD